MAKFRIKKYRKLLAGFLAGVAATLGIIGGLTMIEHHEVALPASGSLTIGWLPSTVTRFRSDIETQARRYNIDPDFVAIIMTLESGGYTEADSGQATGLMQVTPYTASDIAQKYLLQPTKKYDLQQPGTNIEFGVAYLAHLRNVFCDYKDGPTWDSCVELVAAGYNGGPGAANQLFLGNGLKATETVIYSRNAFNMWRERNAKTSPTYDRWCDAGGQSLIDAAKKEAK